MALSDDPNDQMQRPNSPEDDFPDEAAEARSRLELVSLLSTSTTNSWKKVDLDN